MALASLPLRPTRPAGRPRRWQAWGLPLAAWTLLAGFVALGLAGPWLAPHDPRVAIARPLQPPSGRALLGTNDVGQDVLSEWLIGARATLVAAIGVTAISTALAWLAGVTAGLWDRAALPLTSLGDLLLALPAIPLYLLILALVGPSQTTIILTLGLLSWPAFGRIVQATVREVRSAPYVEAAEALGASPIRVAVRHVIPATFGLLAAKVVLTVRFAIFAEASLAFLGLGDPGAKSWGAMLGTAFNYPLLFARGAWLWWVLPPALAIVAVVWATSVLTMERPRG
ncbi:MAG: ABC transporter permease [Dehalococcoidia bacterium]|nr:ABC transporter permease [Dehalococcoidia bacterium]